MNQEGVQKIIPETKTNCTTCTTNPLKRCQYKTGKCFSPRALKRNNELHSLCEMHRAKQNVIQRKSDVKYQKIHALKRRQRTMYKEVMREQETMKIIQNMMFTNQMSPTSHNKFLTHSALPPLSKLFYENEIVEKNNFFNSPQSIQDEFSIDSFFNFDDMKNKEEMQINQNKIYKNANANKNKKDEKDELEIDEISPFSMSWNDNEISVLQEILL